MRHVSGATKDSDRPLAEPIEAPRAVSSSNVDNTAPEDDNKNDDRQLAAGHSKVCGNFKRGLPRSQFRHQPYHNVSHSPQSQNVHHIHNTQQNHTGQHTHQAQELPSHGHQKPLPPLPPDLSMDPALNQWGKPPGLPSYSGREAPWRAAGAALFAPSAGASPTGPRHLSAGSLHHAAAGMLPFSQHHQQTLLAVPSFYPCGYGSGPFPFPPPCGYPQDAAMPCAANAFAQRHSPNTMPACFEFSTPYGMPRPFHSHSHHYMHFYQHQHQRHFHQYHHHYQHHAQHAVAGETPPAPSPAAAAAGAATSSLASLPSPSFLSAPAAASPPSPATSSVAPTPAPQVQTDNTAEQVSAEAQLPLEEANDAAMPLALPETTQHDDGNKTNSDGDGDKGDGEHEEVPTLDEACTQSDAVCLRRVRSSPLKSNGPSRTPVNTNHRRSSALQDRMASKSRSRSSSATNGHVQSDNCHRNSVWRSTSQWSHFPMPLAVDLPSYEDSIAGNAAAAPPYSFPARPFIPPQGAPRPVPSTVKPARCVTTPTTGETTAAALSGNLEDELASASANSRLSTSLVANMEDSLPVQSPPPPLPLEHQQQPSGDGLPRSSGGLVEKEDGRPRSTPCDSVRQPSTPSTSRAGALVDETATPITTYLRANTALPQADKYTRSPRQPQITKTQVHLSELDREPQAQPPSQQPQPLQARSSVGEVPASPLSLCDASAEVPAPLGTPNDRRRPFHQAMPMLYEHHTPQEDMFEERSKDFSFDPSSYGNIVSLINAVSPVVPIVELLEFPLNDDATSDVREVSADMYVENHKYDAISSSMTHVEPSIALLSIWKALDFPFACTVPLLRSVQLAPMRYSQDSLVYTPLLSGFRLRFHESSPTYSRLKSMRSSSSANATHRAKSTKKVVPIIPEPICAMNSFLDGASAFGSTPAAPSPKMDKSPPSSSDYDDGLVTWSATERPDQRSLLLEQIQDLAALGDPYSVLLTATTAELDYESWFAVLWQPVYEQSHMAKNSCGNFIVFYALRPPRHLFRQPGLLNDSIAAINSHWHSPIFRVDREGAQMDVWNDAYAYGLRATNGVATVSTAAAAAESSTTSMTSRDAKPAVSSEQTSCVSSGDAARGTSASMSFLTPSPTAGHRFARIPVVGIVPNRCRGDVWFAPAADAPVGGARGLYRAPLFLLTAALQLMARNAEEELRRQGAADGVPAADLARLSGAQLLVEGARRNRQYREGVTAESSAAAIGGDVAEGGTGKAGNAAGVDLSAVVRRLADFYQWAQFDSPLQVYAERYA